MGQEVEIVDFPYQVIIFHLIGGLGIFVFGIKFMGEGLKNMAGDRLRTILDRYTSTPLRGIISGMVVTILIQSSSGTAVLTVGLVSAGVLSLKKAIAIIMGANIGTTVTAFIIGFQLSEYALPIMALGSLLLFFFKNKMITHAGQTIFGFGSLFLGLEIMGAGLEPLRLVDEFRELMLGISSSPFLGFIAGALFTSVVQSSSASVGVLQELHAQGLITLKASLPILLGDNLGTTITALLASIGASLAAKRTAWAHVLFNAAGAFLFLLLLQPFSLLVTVMKETFSLNPHMSLAFAHGSFNILSTLIQLPLIAVLVKIVSLLVRDNREGTEYRTSHLDPVFIEQSAAIALGQAKEEVLRMGYLSAKGLLEAQDYLFSREKIHADAVRGMEEAINQFDRDIDKYLVRLSSTSLSHTESAKNSMMMNTARDIERVGDHIENLVELVDYLVSHKVTLSDSAMTDLKEIFSLTIFSLEQSIQALDHHDCDQARRVIKNEETIDRMERTLRKKHILRINEGLCSAPAGIIFIDILTNLERIGDHAVNMAEATLNIRK